MQDTRASRWRRSAALALAMMLPAGAPAGQIRVEMDDRAADFVTAAFERGAANPRLSDDIVRSDGYALVFRHQATVSESDPGEVAAEFRRALDSALDGGEDPGFGLERIRTSPARYRQTLREIRAIDGMLRWRVADRLREFFPSTSFTTTAHLVVGGPASGMAFGDHDDITLRLDDFVPENPERVLDRDRLTSVLTHELFHVAYRNAGGPPPRPAQPDDIWVQLADVFGPSLVGEVWRASGLRAWDGVGIAVRLDAWVPPVGVDLRALDEFLAMLGRIQNEGCAVYVDAPLRDPGGSGLHRGEVAAWMRTIDADFDRLAYITERLTHGAGAVEIASLAAEGFEGNGPLYRVGYRVAERADEYGGRRPLLESLHEGPLEFFETYFQTHPYGPGQMDSRTESEIEAIILQIRAMGEFDPEG